MSKREKLLNRLFSVPGDFTWSELILILKYLGYDQLPNRSTGGSRRRFVNRMGKTILLHEPHPSKIVKKYVLRFILEYCKEEIKKYE